jgi:hypothetical protein
VERWFRSLEEGLLAALPGYTGPDVYSRGDKPEQDAFSYYLMSLAKNWGLPSATIASSAASAT